MSSVDVTVSDDGDTITLHRNDLPAVADARAYDITISTEELHGFLLEARRKQLTIDDPTGGL